MKIAVLTLGCKVNQAESSSIEGTLKSGGHMIVNLADKPDVCIVNTCTVTAKSDYQSRQLIRRAHKAGAKVYVTGCYSELNRDSIQAMDGVDEVISNADKMSIINKLHNETISITSSLSNSKSRLFLKVQDGCNYSCSYCTIPRARGKSRSISLIDIISDIDRAVASGFNEVVLTGIHLGTYGIDLKPKVSLSELLATILKNTSIKRMRLSSLEVREIDSRLLELLTDKRVCNHLHIPLQSGSDKILKLMGRMYDSAQFSFKINEVAKRVQGISIGTDVIVGFPGEDGNEFESTRNLIDGLPISYLHVFPFSSRPGTPASTMPSNCSAENKKQRVHTLTTLNQRKKELYLSRQLGKTLDVLIEERLGDGSYCGTSDNYLKVVVSAGNNKIGSIVSSRIESINEGRLIGTPILSCN